MKSSGDILNSNSFYLSVEGEFIAATRTNQYQRTGQKTIDIRHHTRYNIGNLIKNDVIITVGFVGMVAIVVNSMERNG